MEVVPLAWEDDIERSGVIISNNIVFLSMKIKFVY